MKILVLNAGSSSIKFSLFHGDQRLAFGLIEKIGEPNSHFEYQAGETKEEQQTSIEDHKQGLQLIVASLCNPKNGVLQHPEELSYVGHRVVHGGESFTEPALITAEVLDAIKACIPLAPLHNPANVLGIEVAQDVFPKAKQIAVFDTAFHQTLPPKAYRYALGETYYQDHQIRRYGFHGTSHRYVATQAAQQLNRPLGELKLITLHLGNGASMAAINQGQSMDTTMGFTPLEGLVMGTRSGDLDPAIPLYLINRLGKTASEVDQILNKQSGFKGMTGSNDLRTILQKADEGDTQAELALEIAVYRIQKYIGAYLAVLGGLDALVFTAGVGEHSAEFRSRIAGNLGHLGIQLDLELNQKNQPNISGPQSLVKTLVIPTNEELQIASECLEFGG